MTSKIQKSKDGSVYLSEMMNATNKDEILPALNNLCKKLRRYFGESRYKLFGNSKPLSRVTTSSLDALKQYSLGLEKHINLEFEEAVIYYKHAILLDSGFTAAKASLGNLLYEKFDKEKGKEWLDKALVSINDLTNNEKYSILSFYAANVEKNLHKAIKYSNLVCELYPDKAVTHNNLGWYYQNLEIYDKSVDEYKTAIQIDPYLTIAYSGLISTYLQHLGQIDSALLWSNNMRTCMPDNPWPYFYMGSAYVGLDSLKKAEIEFLKAKYINPDFILNDYRLALNYWLQGKYEESNEVLKEILLKNPDEISAHFNLGFNYKMLQKQELAKEHYLECKKAGELWVQDYPENPTSYTSYAIALTCLGDSEMGWKIGKKAIEIDPDCHFNYAQFLVVQGNYNDALDQLGKALKNGYRDLTWIKLNPYISLLRDEDRYKELIKKYFN